MSRIFQPLFSRQPPHAGGWFGVQGHTRQKFSYTSSDDNETKLTQSIRIGYNRKF